MSGPDNLSKIDRLRARDGDHCWLCGAVIDFAATPNSAKAWSVEHLLAKEYGGTEKLENLALCHPPCNRLLANRPVVDKVRLREKRRREAWRAAIKGKVLKALGG
ncbi:HNH endonuclease [Sphingomonas sp. ASV193]|uniref:HNH endonuclease n=1 Tax=Sphingomonas sp. ASV193 TaxID=3144405 RepID=UPI0032E8C8E2